MEFWNNLITEKSWKLLLELTNKQKHDFEFVVIGGWATYLWTRLHKSKDIDIALTDLKTLEYLKQNYELKKNDRLKKYEITFDEIDVDIYVPYYSQLGIPIEDISKYTTKIDNINVPDAEVLLLLKQGAEINRRNSVKGTKDQIDIIGLLLFAEININKYYQLLRKYKKENFLDELRSVINHFNEYHYLGLNPREFKLRKQKIIECLRKVK